VAASGQDEYYTYDGLRQIKTLDRGTLNSGKTGISGTPSWEEDWNFDPMGNWRGTSTAYLTKVSGSTALDQNRSHNTANELTGITTNSGPSWSAPVHDAAGNMTRVPQPLSLTSNYDLAYDAWNRLVEVKVTGGSVVESYTYDGSHRRVTKSSGSTTRHYYYSDQWQILEERLDPANPADRRAVWGQRYIDDLVLRDRDTNGDGSLDERLYVLHDFFNVTAIMTPTGTVVERYGYDAFGAVRYMDGSFGSRSSSSYAWETLFGAYRYDAPTGLYQVRNRYFHSKLGRWSTRDPIAENGGINLYQFVSNDPIDHFDPFGLSSGVQHCKRIKPGDKCCLDWDSAWKVNKFLSFDACVNAWKAPYSPGALLRLGVGASTTAAWLSTYLEPPILGLTKTLAAPGAFLLGYDFGLNGQAVLDCSELTCSKWGTVAADGTCQ
jgi:RHS repeat-associated protein